MSKLFKERKSVYEVEEGSKLQPKFDDRGLIPAVTIHYSKKNILMHGYMNRESLLKTIQTGYAHYWSRSRQSIWKKGETSGLLQKIKVIKIDDDQDCICIEVEVLGNGASCHVGYKSCFYRKINLDKESEHDLVFIENEKVFEPNEVYGNAPNPTKL